MSRVKSSSSLSNSSLSSPQQTSSLAHEVAPEIPELLLLATPDQPSGGMPPILTTNHVLTLGDANSHPSWDTLLYPHPSVSCRSLLSGRNRTISSAKNRNEIPRSPNPTRHTPLLHLQILSITITKRISDKRHPQLVGESNTHRESNGIYSQQCFHYSFTAANLPTPTDLIWYC